MISFQPPLSKFLIFSDLCPSLDPPSHYVFNNFYNSYLHSVYDFIFTSDHTTLFIHSWGNVYWNHGVPNLFIRPHMGFQIYLQRDISLKYYYTHNNIICVLLWNIIFNFTWQKLLYMVLLHFHPNDCKILNIPLH